MNLSQLAPRILASSPGATTRVRLGFSREGRPIWGHRIGSGTRVSLIAGCHADEPVGPRLLRHFTGYLESLPSRDPLIRCFEWWIVPHANPDGAARNDAWAQAGANRYDLLLYLRHAVREGPGDDIEFGFPRDPADDSARPENDAIYRWWRSTPGPFALHASLHGMAMAAGPWFLIDAGWVTRTETFRARCREAVLERGYVLHDVERRGEKGFVRIERGFATRPDSGAMRRFFLERGEPETARAFRPSSMESVRSLGGDPLTLVTELPLFITPGVAESLGPPDPVAEEWRERFARWRARLVQDHDSQPIREEVQAVGLRPMSVRDQMILQWTCLAHGLEAVGLAGGHRP